MLSINISYFKNIILFTVIKNLNPSWGNQTYNVSNHIIDHLKFDVFDPPGIRLTRFLQITYSFGWRWWRNRDRFSCMRRKVENRTLPSVSAASEGFSLNLAWCHFLHLLLLCWIHPSGAPENVSAQLHPMSFTQPIVTSEDPKNKWFLRDSDS